MRLALIAAACLCFASVSFAQPPPTPTPTPLLQLAPNPACPGNSSFCRPLVSSVAGFVPTVMGFNNGFLYSWVGVAPGTGCPTNSDQLPPVSVQTFCFYQSSSFAPETWTYLGSYAPPPSQPAISGTEMPIEIVFGPGACSGYTYVYTDSHRVLRASNGWNFTSLTNLPNIPNIPSNTAGKVASFAVADQGSQTRIFYGNYPSPNCQYTTTAFAGDLSCPKHPATCVSGSDPSVCPHAYIWHSDDCGDTWSAPFPFGEPEYHAQEVHAINVDPTNPLNIYVTIDVENADLQPVGLWKSTDGGMTYTQLSNIPSAYPSLDISPKNFVLPSGSNYAFLESDGDSALNMLDDRNNNNPQLPGGPLVSLDAVNGGAFQVAAPWPGVSQGAPLWAGTANAISLTSEQNIFLWTNAGGRDKSKRQGIWYFAPPYYNMPRLLGEFTAPINSVTATNQVATAVTFEPAALQPSDTVAISGVNVAGFNITLDPTQNPLTVVGPDMFSYPCPGCPDSPQGTGGYATVTGRNVIFRTIEVTDPTTNFTYLYNGNTRFVKPEFTGAQQTLSNLNVGGGYLKTYFIGTDEHVHQLLNNTNTGGWGNWDISSSAQAPTNILPTPGSALSSLWLGYPYDETFFIGTDQHVHMLLNNLSEDAWGNWDINSQAHDPTNIPPVAGSALSSNYAGGSYYETFFIGTDLHVHMLLNNSSEGAWGNHDVSSYATGPSSVVPLVGSALSSVYQTNGNTEVFFIGMDQHVHILLNSAGSWVNYDLNSLATSPTAVTPANWTQLSALDLGSGNSEVFFVGTDLHVHRLLNMNGVWENDDVNSLAPPLTSITPMLGSSLRAVSLTANATATFFIGTDQHVHRLYFNGNGGWENDDVNSLGQAPTNVIPAIRSPYTIINLGSGNSEIFFIGIDGDMHMFLNNAGQWGNWDPNPQSPTNALPATP